tara:strand:- start:1475 stop:1822 length:348 start_codon:yes stop_codon:yes gene_type:complete
MLSELLLGQATSNVPNNWIGDRFPDRVVNQSPNQSSFPLAAPWLPKRSQRRNDPLNDNALQDDNELQMVRWSDKRGSRHGYATSIESIATRPDPASTLSGPGKRPPTKLRAEQKM